jgi:hypothetical protein
MFLLHRNLTIVSAVCLMTESDAEGNKKFRGTHFNAMVLEHSLCHEPEFGCCLRTNAVSYF